MKKKHFLTKTTSSYFLLLFLFLPVLFFPLTPTKISSKIIFEAVFFFTLISGALTLTNQPVLKFIAVVSGILTVSCVWINYFFEVPFLRTISVSLSIIFAFLLIIGNIRKLLAQDRIDGETMAGGICVYLLIGIAFAQIFWLIYHHDPQAFNISSGRDLAHHVNMHPSQLHEYSARFSGFLYFSFVTLTTLGYGDISPNSGAAESAAILEAIIGQLYIALLIGRLVGMHLGQIRQKD